MAEDFPSFSTSKNAVPHIRRENWAILEKLQDFANSQSTFYSTQKNKILVPKNLTIDSSGLSRSKGRTLFKELIFELCLGVG